MGGGGGGGENLPNRGIAGYAIVEVPAEGSAAGSGDEADATIDPRWVALGADGVRYREPSAWVTDDAIEVLLEVRSDSRSRLAWLRSTDDGSTWSAPVEVLDGSGLGAPFETDAGLSAPSVWYDGTQWFVAFGYGDGAGIGLAAGPTLDTLRVAPDPLLVAEGSGESDGIGAPSLVEVDAVWHLYYATSGQEAEVDGGGALAPYVALATGAGPGGMARQGAVIDGGVCSPEIEECLEAIGVASPEVRVATTAAGRRVLRMFYGAGDDGVESLGFAASFDGRSWSRFAYNPAQAEDRFDEYGATNVIVEDRYQILYTREAARGPRGVVQAVHRLGGVSDRW